MRVAVRENFIRFTAPFEGVCPYLYLDVLGLVTTAIGVLVDPIEYALSLPFMKPDGTPATRDEIASEWRLVKNSPGLAKAGHLAARRITKLRLTDNGVERVVLAKLDVMEAALRKRFPEWDEFPADAQLATLSMSWACGPGFKFPTLEAAIRAQNWQQAAQSCHINTTGNPGVAPRNDANRDLYGNAAWIADRNLDRDTLIWTVDHGPEAA